MKNEIIIDRYMKTASVIYLNDVKINEIEDRFDPEWKHRLPEDIEEFDKHIQKEANLYKKLNRYNKLIRNMSITDAEYDKLKDNIQNLISGEKHK